MPKRDRAADVTTGGYIGEAQRDAKRVRKPAPFMIEGDEFAWIESDCYIRFLAYRPHPARRHRPHLARRLAAWLTRAAAWIESKA